MITCISNFEKVTHLEKKGKNRVWDKKLQIQEIFNRKKN